MALAISDSEIKFRVSSRAKEKWAAAAEAEKISMSAWIKDACRAKARGEQVANREIIKCLDQIRVDFERNHGNNLNQLAKYHNTVRRRGGDITNLIDEVDDLVLLIERKILELKVS